MWAALTGRRAVVPAFVVALLLVGVVGVGLRGRLATQRASSAEQEVAEQPPSADGPDGRSEAPANAVRQQPVADKPRILPIATDRGGSTMAKVGDRDVPLVQAVVYAPKSEDVSIQGAVVTINGTGEPFAIPKLQMWQDANGDGRVQADADTLIAEVDGARIAREGTRPYHSTQTLGARGASAPTCPADSNLSLLISVSRIGPIGGAEQKGAEASPPQGEQPGGTPTIRIPPPPQRSSRAPMAGLLVAALAPTALCLRRRRAVLLPLLLAIAVALPACEMSAPEGTTHDGPTLQVILTGVRMRGVTSGRDCSKTDLSIHGTKIMVEPS